MINKNLLKLSFDFSLNAIIFSEKINKNAENSEIVSKFLITATNIGAIIYRKIHETDIKVLKRTLINAIYLLNETNQNIRELLKQNLIDKNSFNYFYPQIIKMGNAIKNEIVVLSKYLYITLNPQVFS